MKTIIILLTAFVLQSCLTDTSAKQYILEHRAEVQKTNACYFRIDSIPNGYYTDVTIEIHKDSSFSMVFWGNRGSWQWRFRKDKQLSVDIPYNRYKRKDVSDDVLVYWVLKSK